MQPKETVRDDRQYLALSTYGLLNDPAQRFTSTAYCRGTTTADGTRVRRGIVAADPKVLPLGSVIRIRGLAGGLDGDYVVADTGPKVRGRQIDIYMDDCRRAVRFGRQRVEVTLLRRT